MYVTSRIPNVAFLGLLVSLYLLSDRCCGTAETIVDTEPHVVLEVGTRGILPCRIQRRAYLVQWKRQLSSETVSLLSLDPYFIVDKRDGPGYEAGLFNITDDYSLVIKDVKVQDEGLYMCSFYDFQTGKPFQNSTRVSVQAFPDEPFPTIQECIGKEDENSNSGVCTLTVHSTSNLTCFVKGYYPNIDLFFLHGSKKVTSTENEEWSNADGTKNKQLGVQISVSDEPYECVASGLLGMVEKRSVLVIVQTRSPDANVAAIVTPVLMAVGISLSIAVFFLYRRRNKRGWRSKHGFILAHEETPLMGNSRISLSFKRSVLGRWFFQGLFRPHDVIYRNGKYFITDTGHHCVSSYNPATETYTTECRVLWSKLYGLASLSDPDQGILVTDNRRGCVYRIDNTGGYYEWASGLKKPTGITTHKGEVFVAEFDTNNIKKYNEKGEHLPNFDSKSYLKQPWFLAVNSKDHLYVTDSEAIKVFTTNGIYQGSFTVPNQGNWRYRGIAIDRYDNVFVTARDGEAFKATETIAAFSKHLCVKQISADIDSMHCLRGLCINDDRHELVVVDGEWHRLKLFELYES